MNPCWIIFHVMDWTPIPRNVINFHGSFVEQRLPSYWTAMDNTFTKVFHEEYIMVQFFLQHFYGKWQIHISPKDHFTLTKVNQIQMGGYFWLAKLGPNLKMGKYTHLYKGSIRDQMKKKLYKERNSEKKGGKNQKYHVIKNIIYVALLKNK